VRLRRVTSGTDTGPLEGPAGPENMQHLGALWSVVVMKAIKMCPHIYTNITFCASVMMQDMTRLF